MRSLPLVALAVLMLACSGEPETPPATPEPTAGTPRLEHCLTDDGRSLPFERAVVRTLRGDGDVLVGLESLAVHTQPRWQGRPIYNYEAQYEAHVIVKRGGSEYETTVYAAGIVNAENCVAVVSELTY